MMSSLTHRPCVVYALIGLILLSWLGGLFMQNYSHLTLKQMYYHFLPTTAMWTHYFHAIHADHVRSNFQTALPCLFNNASIDISTRKIISSTHQSLGCFAATTQFSLATPEVESTEGLDTPNQLRKHHHPPTASTLCSAGYASTYYLVGNVEGLPLNSRSHLGNFFHFLVEYAGRIHVALIETGITVERVHLLVESNHVFPPEQFVPILAASLGWDMSTKYSTMYEYIDQTNVVCATQLVVGWPTWRMWWILPNQQRWMDPSFAHGWDSMRLHLWRMLGLSLAEAERKQRHSCLSKNTNDNSMLNVVYWSRGFGARSVVNRDELAKTMATTFSNFQLVDPMPLAIPEQLAIVSKADILVGPHGAGLSWIVAMRPQTAMVELTPLLHMRNELYKNVGQITGNRYYRHVPCDGYNISSTDPGLSGDLANRHKNHRLKCDPQSVLQATLDVKRDMLCRTKV